jgi:hypothetical protein
MLLVNKHAWPNFVDMLPAAAAAAAAAALLLAEGSQQCGTQL